MHQDPVFPEQTIDEARLPDVGLANHGQPESRPANALQFRRGSGSACDHPVQQVATSLPAECRNRDGLAEAQGMELVLRPRPRPDRPAC